MDSYLITSLRHARNHSKLEVPRICHKGIAYVIFMEFVDGLNFMHSLDRLRWKYGIVNMQYKKRGE